MIRCGKFGKGFLSKIQVPREFYSWDFKGNELGTQRLSSPWFFSMKVKLSQQESTTFQMCPPGCVQCRVGRWEGFVLPLSAWGT